MKWLYLSLLPLLFTACELLESPEDKAKKTELQKIAFEKKISQEKDIQLKKLDAKIKIELALLESKKELALIEQSKDMNKAKLEAKKELVIIEKNQELAKIRMKSELAKQKILLEEEKKEALFQQKIQQIDQVNNMELKRYLIIILAVLVLVSSFFIFYYFKKRREDKLLAYNDNLQKYFHQKENDARIRIAEKLLDTIASGNLDKSQENQLIGALSGNTSTNDTYQQQLTNDKESIEIEDVELVEEEKVEEITKK